MEIEERIKELVPDDEYVVGFADLTGLLHKKYKNYTHAVVIGKKLDDRIIDSIEQGPNIEYFNLYNETNKNLSSAVHRVGRFLSARGIPSCAIEPTGSQNDREKPVYNESLALEHPHKMGATRAGLGWIGKTDLLVSRKFGPRLRLATVLTACPLQPSGMPENQSRCGSCTICVDRCPAEAANGKAWSVEVKREEFFDPFKCRDKCVELCWKNMKINATICGICISVCPVGKKAPSPAGTSRQ
ncbi:MAG: epoxyqueuosine reductase [Spirochaetota bacterium]